MRPDLVADIRPDGLIPANWFALIASWTLRRSFRTNEYTSLISIRARRQLTGFSVDVAPSTLMFAEVIASTIRASDLVGELPDDGFGILVSNADEGAACCVILRIGEALAAVDFPAALTFSIGVGVCPTHGFDVRALLSYALLHPALNIIRCRRRKDWPVSEKSGTVTA